MLVKMIATAEALGTTLDPGFDIVAVLTPYAQQYVRSRLSPEMLLRRAREAAKEAVSLGMDAPESVRRVLGVLESGGFDVHLRADELEELMGKVEKLGTRVVAGAVLAAVINGSAHIVASDPGRFKSWYPALVGAGAGSAGMIGGYLAWSLRPRRRR